MKEIKSNIKESFRNKFYYDNFIEKYNMGKELGDKFDHNFEKYISSLSYSDERYPEMGDISELFFKSGFLGLNIPEIAIGWRYGDIPESGKSHNYRDNFQEEGLSMMEIYDHNNDENFDKISTLFMSDRKKVECVGFMHFSKGSDGEFLLVGAEKI